MVSKIIPKILYKLSDPSFFFLSLGLIMGISIALVLPPFHGPDEASHIYRTYEISKGDIILDTENNSGGFRIPDALHRVNIASFNEKGPDWNSRVQKYIEAGTPKTSDSSQFQIFEGAGTYSPLAYINYIPFSLLGRLLNLNEYHYTLLLRIGGLIISIITIYAAIRITPVGKWLIASIGLLPMSIHQMSVVSTDGLIISMSLLFASVVASLLWSPDQQKLRHISQKYTLSWQKVTILMGSGICVASKPGYWPLLLLLTLVFPTVRSVIKLENYRYIAVIAIPVLLFVSWYGILVLQHQSNLRNYFETANPNSTLINPKQVIKETINPIALTKRFSETYIIQPYFPRLNFDFETNYQPSFVFNTFVGSFGSLAAYPPSWLSITVILSLLFAIMIDPIKKSLDKIRSYIVITLGFIGLMLISYIFWISWTAEDMPFIFGIQGRYFIPLLALALFLLPDKKVINISKQLHIRLLIGCILINSWVTIITISSYFYAVK